MKLVAAGLFAIALAIVIHAAVIFAIDDRPDRCTLGGGEGLPVVVVDCSDIPRP